jgi:FkbH-like protein
MHATTDPQVSGPRNRSNRRKLANALKRNRRAAALCLKDSIAGWEKFAPQLESTGIEAFIAWETIPLVDYLINYLQSDNSTWRDLFVGERLKQLHWAPDTLPEMIARRERVFTADRDALLLLLRPHVSADERDQLALLLDEIRETVTTGAQSSREVKILLVGDCLFLDLCTFLAVPLLNQGITLRPVYATSKNPIELRSTLRGLTGEHFDLICYSPYSYEFNILLAQTHYPKGIFSGRRSLRALAGDAHRQIASTLRLLSEEFNCSVFVHNTANIRRHNNSPASYAKSFVTSYARKVAAKEANTLLANRVADQNMVAPRPVVVIDELALVARHGELTLGKKFYDSEPQHPTVMALRLAEVYRDLVCAAKYLVGKKVVVADLDNTLWKGVIGEGSVEHDHRRQQVLKLLRQKGVLLAIASKNDPANVRWTGATLQDNDFVASQINWGPKATSIKRIAEELNLKLKDFVFLDDRPDEREMVHMAIPAVHCLDASADSTWQMLDWWAAALPEQTEGDRTQMYLERKLRQAHLDEVAEQEDQQQLLSSLGLRLEIRQASQKELARAAELINRTNQFNTCGSRVTTQQVAAWSASAQHQVLVAEAADKFGSMGIISAMVLEQLHDAVQIPVWVLSCRVFGYGIETAMLNQVRRNAQGLGTDTIRGIFVETPHNQPCRDVYQSNGFSWNGTVWERRGMDIAPDPAWLSVTVMDESSAIPRA